MTDVTSLPEDLLLIKVRSSGYNAVSAGDLVKRQNLEPRHRPLKRACILTRCLDGVSTLT